MQTIFKLSLNNVAISNDICGNFKGYFQLIESNYSTRNNSKLIRLPVVKPQVANKGFYFFGGKCYNDLPTEIRSAYSLQDFRRLLRGHSGSVPSLVHSTTLPPRRTRYV